MAIQPATILAIGLSSDDLGSLCPLIRQALPQAQLITAEGGATGIAAAETVDPDVILVPLGPPELEGLATCRALKASELLRDIPVVFLTGHRADRESRIKGLEAGADGFIAMPADEAELVTQIRAMAKIRAAGRIRSADGESLAAQTVGVGKWKAELRAAEELFRTLAETTSTSISIYQDERCVFANRATLRRTGYAEDEFLRLRISDLIHPDDRLLVQEHLQAGQRGEQTPDSIEVKFRRKDGGERWMDFCTGEISWHGRPAIMVSAFDITVRKRTEHALRQSEEKFRNLFANASVGMFRTRLDGSEVLDVNDKFLEIFDRPRTEELGAAAMINWADPLDREEMVRRLQAAGTVTDFECSMVNKWGETRRCLASMRLYHEQGILEGSILDITERKRAEAALRESEERYRTLFEGVPVSVFRVGLGGEHLDANPAHLRILGYTDREAWFGEAIPAHYPDPGDRQRWRAIAERDGAVRDYEMTMRRNDGKEILVQLNARAVRGSDGQLAYFEGSLVDITERKLAAERLLELNIDLDERVSDRTAQLAAANAELEAFAYSVSHDLRAPLRAICSFSEILATRHKDALNEQGQKYLGFVIQAGSQMRVLIDDLLRYSRLGRSAVRSQDVDCQRVLARSLDLLADPISASQAEILVPRGLPVVRGDPTLVEQIMLNLLDNALKYHLPGLPPQVTISWEGEAHWVTLSVEDHGIGIPPEHHDKIFNVFQRLHGEAEYPGTGIGLALVKKAAELMGGAVGVTSMPGTGSLFWVRLPSLTSGMEPTK